MLREHAELAERIPCGDFHDLALVGDAGGSHELERKRLSH